MSYRPFDWAATPLKRSIDTLLGPLCCFAGQVPVRSILLAIFMFVMGSMLITIGALLMVGIIGSATTVRAGPRMRAVKRADRDVLCGSGRMQTDVRALPLLFLGSILFIPGAYHVRLAYLAYNGYNGYDFSQIPTFDED